MCPKNLKNELYIYTQQNLIRYPALKPLPGRKRNMDKVGIQYQLIVIEYC